MLLNRSAALLLVAIFGFTWVQASVAKYPWIEEQLNPFSITKALSSIVTPLPFNPNDRPVSYNKQRNSQRFDIDIGRDYVLSLVVLTFYDARRFTLEEKATVMTFVIHFTQNILSELKIQSDNLVYLLHTLIEKDKVTTLKRLSRMIDHSRQARFVDLLTAIDVQQSNIAAVQDLLKSYQTIDVWRTSLRRTEMIEELVALYKTVSSLSNSNKTLWREFYLILSM